MTAISKPPKINHKMFSNNEPPPLPGSTSLPNGKKDSDANLKHCNPTGIPTMLIHQSIPVTIQRSPSIAPPKINHRKLPTQPMLNLLSRLNTEDLQESLYAYVYNLDCFADSCIFCCIGHDNIAGLHYTINSINRYVGIYIRYAVLFMIKD